MKNTLLLLFCFSSALAAYVPPAGSLLGKVVRNIARTRKAASSLPHGNPLDHAKPRRLTGRGSPGRTWNNSAFHQIVDCHSGRLEEVGGIDKIELAKGPKATKAYLESVRPLVERGGYIPFCDHRCPPNVKQEDYLYYLNLKEEMFGMGAADRHSIWRQARLELSSERG